MQKRVRWKQHELRELGMAIDRLMLDESTRLTPKWQLVQTYAQKHLPIERRRELTKVEAETVIARIDKLREEQEVAEFMGQDVVDVGSRPYLPSDPEEAKRLAMLFARMGEMEDRIVARLIPEMEKMMQRQFSELIDAITGSATPAPVEKPSMKIAVAYPADASWADEVRPALKKLTKENIKVSAIAIGRKTNDIQVSEFGLIIALDSMAESAHCGFTMVRMKDLFEKSSLPFDRLKQVRCATSAQIVGHVRETILAYTH